jgi:SnoaL-like domain
MDQNILCKVGDVINRYWYALDHRNYPALLGLLTEDVDWQLASVQRGREAVAAAMEARPADLVARHLVSNLTVEAVGHSFEAKFLVTAFGKRIPAEVVQPVAAASPAAIADVVAQLVDTPDGLKISRLRAFFVFRDPA